MNNRLPATTPAALTDVLATATGTSHRDDPVTGRTGGPAGNARLTAWSGLLLLGGFLAECVTLISLRSMLAAHIVLGAFLVPLVLLKTATTGWRILRYYLGSAAYRRAGPPPLLLRLLGPLVVFTGLAVLGSGLALVALGPATFTPIFTAGGVRIDPLTVHQASFVAWLAVTGLHVLARTVPAVQIAAGSKPQRHRVPGVTSRVATLLLTATLGAAVSAVVLHRAGDWTSPGSARSPGVGDGQRAPR